MGTSRQTISKIESGTYEGFTRKTLEKLTEATGTRVKIEVTAILLSQNGLDLTSGYIL
jgi:transcriptional regulator with XRE-family HTH domain